MKLLKDRETLFDEDRNGIPFMGVDNTTSTAIYATDVSLIGDAVSVPAALTDPCVGEPMMFETPLHFESGEELLVYLNCSWVTAGSLAVAEIRVGMIMNVKTQ